MPYFICADNPVDWYGLNWFEGVPTTMHHAVSNCNASFAGYVMILCTVCLTGI
jgi:hypothetical protein